MKKYLTAFAMTQSMFCSLPCPFHMWDEESRPYMLLFLPLVGLEIGVFWAVLSIWGHRIGLPDMIYGCAMCALPYLMTGFIHLDGFMDVADAIGSWRSTEERRKILKDPHVGSFAVIGCVFLLITGFALFASSASSIPVMCFVMIPVMSRCCSSMAIGILPPMQTSQYAHMQTLSQRQRALLIGIVILCMIFGFIFMGRYGWTFVGEGFGYVLALRFSYKALGGMNGDISGFCLTISELCGIGVCVLI